MIGKWDYLRRRAEANDMPLLVNAGELLDLIAQAERADDFRECLACALDVHLEDHAKRCATCSPIIASVAVANHRAALKGETP